MEDSALSTQHSALTAEPLRYKTARAALASGTSQIVTRILAVVLSIASARALEPREVGTLGIAVIIIGIVSMIAYYPETAAVTARTREADGRFAVASLVIKASVLTLLLVSVTFAYPVLAEYLTGKEGGGAQLRRILLVLWWAPVLELFGAYPRVLLQRRLELNWVSLAALLQPVIFVGLAVALLWKGYGYLGVAWANVIGTGAATLFLWSTLLLQRRIGSEGLPWKEVWRETLSGSIRMFTGGFGGFLGERVDNLLVSGALGPTPMSFYSMAWNGSRTPANLFGSTIGFVLIPTLARIQDEPARVRRAVQESLRHAYLLLAPMCGALLVSAPLIVSYVLGDKWLPLVPCLRVMCLTVLAIPLIHACNALLVGSGRAHLTGVGTTLHLIALVIAIPLFARRWNILGAAYADFAATTIMTVALVCVARLATRQLGARAMSVIALPVSAAFLAALLSWSVAGYTGRDIAGLVTQVGVLFLSYAFFIILLGGREALAELAGLLRGALRRRSLVAESRA